jgi:uncharacterized protein YifE (UPF0438 family)
MEYSVELLLEGRREDAYEKYVRSGEVPQNLFNRLVNGDPSGNQKYLMWMLNTLEKVGAGNEERYYMNLVEDVTFFHNNIQSFKNKDINSYNWESFTEGVGNKRAEIHEKQKIKQAKKESIKIYEDNKVLILIPKSYIASCTYGAGTRWCTTSKDSDNYYKQYTKNGLLIYAIRKGIPESDNLHKIAFYLPNDEGNNIQIFNAPDIQVGMEYLKDNLGEEVWDSLRQPIMDYLNNIGNPRVEQFMTDEEIVSYLESGDVDILKFSEKKLMDIFKTFEKITEFVESKGLNPLYTLPPLFVIKGMGVNTRDYLEHYNVNLFDYVAYVIEKLDGGFGVVALTGLYKRWWEEYNFDELFDELEKSKFKDFETFFNFLGENISMEHWARIGGIKVFYSFLFNGDVHLMYDYFNSYNKDVTEFMTPTDLYTVLGDTTVNYVKDFDKLLEFSSELMEDSHTPLDTLIEMGYTSEDVKYLITESVILQMNVTIDMLRYSFLGDGEAGLKWFFSNNRMDMYINDMGNYSIEFTDIIDQFGNATFEFIENELESLGETVHVLNYHRGWVGAGDYDFTDEEDLYRFIGEQINDLELHEFYKRTDDIKEYLEVVDRYGKEVSQLMEVKLVHTMRYGDSEVDKDVYEKMKSNVIGQISDLEMRGEELYLKSSGWCEFKPWVSSYNEDMFQYYFCDEDHHEMFYDTIYDWAEQVWENIDKENMVMVRDYIKNHNIGDEVTNDDDETVEITVEFIDGISDSDLGTIVDNDLDDLKNELSQAYHWGYNNAYESEFSDKVMEDITDYLGSSKEDVKWESWTREMYDGTTKEFHHLYFKVSFDVILDNLNTLADSYFYHDTESEEYEYNDYTDLVGELINEYDQLDGISINMPDHPYDPEKHFNELIGDYI